MGQSESNGDGDGEVELAQIQGLYTAFIKECPSGALHMHEFRNIFGISSSSEEECLYIERVFKSFDQNKVGFLKS